jgi:hypothetical protein
LTAVVAGAALAGPALGASGAASSPVPVPAANPSTEALAASLRNLVLEFMPSPLYEDHKHWGTQKEVKEVEWKDKGLRVHPEKVKVMKNDGHWWKVLVQAPGLPDKLSLDVRNLQQPAPGQMTFTALIAFDATVDYEKQHWHAGLRTWSGSVRARTRLKLTLDCEVQSRLEVNGLLPDVVFRLRVLRSDLKYDKLVITHIPGAGGDVAQVLGDALHASLKLWRPSLEHKLLDRANAAILKAADTKEVRVSLIKLAGSK